jgi:hypothetical protein
MLPPVSLPKRGMHDARCHAGGRAAAASARHLRGVHGFFTLPKALFSLLLPMANSSQLVRPRITASAASRRSTTVALYKEVKPSRMRELRSPCGPCSRCCP